MALVVLLRLNEVLLKFLKRSALLIVVALHLFELLMHYEKNLSGLLILEVHAAIVIVEQHVATLDELTDQPLQQVHLTVL